MYAVIKTGGKQYRVEEGVVLRVEKLSGDKGSEVTLDQVLLVGGDEAPVVGTPVVEGAAVSARIERQGRAKKVHVFKYKKRKKYRRLRGHRQPFTELKILSINT